MREYKFRVWDNKHKVMVTAENVTELVDRYIGESMYEYDEWYPMSSIEIPFMIVNDENYILLQYTGCKDKNEIEIYEGDILHTPVNNITVIVKFGILDGDYDRFNGFYMQLINTETALPLTPKTIDCPTEVIGNIYENPELLEE